MVTQLTVPDRICLLTQVHTCLIQSHGVKGGQHTDIGQDRCVIFIMTVTVRRYIHDQTDMEAWTAVAHCLGILRDFTAEDLICRIIKAFYRFKIAGSDASSTTLALIRIDISLSVLTIGYGIASADLCTLSAAAA